MTSTLCKLLYFVIHSAWSGVDKDEAQVLLCRRMYSYIRIPRDVVLRERKRNFQQGSTTVYYMHRIFVR